MYKVDMQGFSMVLQGDNYLEEQIIRTGSWEPATTEVFREYVRPGMTVVDVGANIGYFSLLSASLVGTSGQVHAFEPYPGYQKRLKASLACNSFEQVKLVPFALSDKVESHELHKGLASARMHKWQHDNPVFAKIHDTVTVRCLPLDEYAERYLQRMDVLKIDVDGYEMNVLRGGRESLRKYKPVVIIEIFEEALADAGTSAGELLTFFRELGYTVYSEQGTRLDYETLEGQATRDPKTSINVVMRPERTDAVVRRGGLLQTDSGQAAPEIRKDIKLGVVLDLAFHQQNRWVSATTGHFVQSLLDSYACRVIQNQNDYEAQVHDCDALISMEPGWCSPKIDYTRTDALREAFARIPTYIYMSDPHAHQWRQDYFLQHGFDTLLSFYWHPMLHHFRAIDPQQILHLPWAIPDHWINDDAAVFGGSSTLCCFGGQKGESYALRNWCREFAFVESATNSGCENKVMSEAEYIRWLGQKDACIAAGSDSIKYRLTVPKYFEIAAAGALLFAQETDDLERLGFAHGQNCIIFNRGNFESLAQDYLSAPERYLGIREAGRDLIRSRHTLSIRLREFDNHLRQSILEKTNQSKALPSAVKPGLTPTDGEGGFEYWYKKICVPSVLAKAQLERLEWQGRPLEWDAAYEILAYHTFAGGKLSIDRLLTMSNQRYALLDRLWPAAPLTREKVETFYFNTASVLPWGHGQFLSDHNTADRRQNWMRRYRLLEILKQRGVREVCDYGAGRGYTTLLARSMGFTRVVHHEYSVFHPYIEWTLERINAVQGSNCRFEFSAAEGPLEPAEPVEAILCTDVAEHVWDPRDLLAQIHKALKPGGWLVWCSCFGEGIQSHLHPELKGREEELLSAFGFRRVGAWPVASQGHSGIYQAVSIPAERRGRAPANGGSNHASESQKQVNTMDEVLAANQSMSREEIRHFQWQNLTRLLRHVYEHVPFYRRRFESCGMHPDDIRTMDDFRKLPVLRKAEIQQHREQMRAANFRADQLFTDATGGSTGEPLVFHRDQAARQWILAAARRFRRWMGYDETSKLALIWGADRDIPKVARPNERWLNAFNCSEADIERFMEELVRWQPDAIRAYSSSMAMVAEYVQRKGIRAPRPRVIECAAEKLWDHQRKQIEAVFGCPVYEMYGSREVPALASECECHKGMHIFSDIRLIETLDGGRPAGPGQEGSLIITDLLNYGMPLIRYEIGDVGVISDRSCSCGRGFGMLEEIKGRVSSTIRTHDGRRIHGEYFAHLFYHAGGVKAFQVHQTALNAFKVLIEPADQFKAGDIQPIICKMQEHLGTDAKIEWTTVDSIPRTRTGKRHFTLSDVGSEAEATDTRETAIQTRAAEAIMPAVKKNVLIFVDKPGWAHDFKTDQLIRNLSDAFEFKKHYCDEPVCEEDIRRADLIVIYYWRVMRSQSLKKVWPLLEQNRHKVLMGICSHVELEGELYEPGLRVIKALAGGGVFANSRLLYNTYAHHFDVPVYYTPNGVDTTFFTPGDRPVRNARLTIGWAGSLTTNGCGKGYHEFIVPAARAAGVEVLAAAREDSWRTKEQMLEFYRKIDVYVCASLNEGTPNPCLEAASCGAAILTTRVGNMPELIEPGVNGYFVERDVQDIAEKLRMLRDDPELLNRLQSNARKAVLAWDWKVNAENYRKMFRERLEANESVQPERKPVSITPESLPLVSVIIPTHNRPEMLKYAIASVLNQTYANIEIIVVNDAGEPVDDVVSGLNLRGNIVSLRHETNKGLGAARNTGLRAARGKYICYLDDDDMFFRDHVKTLVTALEASPLKAAHTNAVRSLQVKKDGKYVEVDRTVPYTRAVNHDDLLVQNMVPVLCVMHEKACVEKTGFFDEMLKTHEDWDFWIRMSRHYEFLHIPEVTSLVTWREDGTTMSSSKHEEFRRIPERMYARYRDWVKDKPDVQARQAARLRMLGIPVDGAADPVRSAQATCAEEPAAAEPIGCAAGRKYRVAIKFCTPSQKLRNWGDTWFARGLQRAFLQAGHECVIHSREEWDQPDDEIDIAIHLKGLNAYTPKPHCFNVIWVISHPELHTAEELNKFDAVFCGSKKYLEHIKPQLKVPCWYLPQAADTTVFAPIEKAADQDIDLLFVGSNYYQNKNRQIIADVLATGRDYNLWIIGPYWKGHVDDKYVKGEYVLPEKLAELYARTKIVLNDHHDTMRQWGFVNDRTYSLAASNVFQISDDVDGLDELGVVTYRTVEDLREKIDFYLGHESERLRMAAAVHDRCKAFSFAQTAERMLQGVVSQWSVRAGKREQIEAVETGAASTGISAPKVSVIMPCHNAEKYLAETLDTLTAQTLTEWELLAIDDGSTDQTLSILKSYAEKDGRVRLWQCREKRGPYSRRNFAIRQARSEFISIQDADDLMHPEKLESLYAYICSNPRIGIAGSYHRRFRETFRGEDFGDAVLRPTDHAGIMQGFKNSWYLGWHGSTIIRKSVFDVIGPYDEQPYGSDTFWLAKAGLYSLVTRAIEFGNVPKFLTYKREHGASQTGLISPTDPRSRRHYLEKYYLNKLTEIAQNVVKNPNLDAGAALKACTCTEFIPVFGHLFETWESEPVTEAMCTKMLERAAAQFAAELYVSCLITLDRLEQMTGAQSKTWRNLPMIAGLAAYASGDDERAAVYLRQEARVNKSAADLLHRIESGTAPCEARQRRGDVKDLVASNQGAIGIELPPGLSELKGTRPIRPVAAGGPVENRLQDRQTEPCGHRV